MRNISLNFLTLFFVIGTFAQKEIKLNPIGALFGSPDLSGEYIINKNVGAELTLSAEMGKYGFVSVNEGEIDPRKSGFGIMGSGKYYLNPKDGADGVFTGLYLRYKSFKVDDKESTYHYAYKRNSTSAGLLLGYKWVAESGFVFEISGGAGRTFYDNIEWQDEDGSNAADFSIRLDAIGKIALGYRF